MPGTAKGFFRHFLYIFIFFYVLSIEIHKDRRYNILISEK